jgi:hypothetical protein
MINEATLVGDNHRAFGLSLKSIVQQSVSAVMRPLALD